MVQVLAERFARFDMTWAALTPEDRAMVLGVFLDSDSRQDRVTVRLGREKRGTGTTPKVERNGQDQAG